MFYMRNIDDIGEFPGKKRNISNVQTCSKKCFKRLIVCYLKETPNLERPNYV